MTSIPADVNVSDRSIRRESHPLTLWNRISWGPIMMGAVCAIGLQFIFTVLGIALGASTGEVTSGDDVAAASTIGFVAGLWWLITGTLSLVAGGMIFGRLSGLPRSLPLHLEAAVMWGVVALFGFLVVWSGAGALTQAASPMGAIASMSNGPSASNAAGVNSQEDFSSISAISEDDRVAMAEAARRATRTASWWSVAGLLVGLGATIGAASAAAPTSERSFVRP